MINSYKIGVAIALTNGVSAALKVIQTDVLGLKKAVDFTQGSFNRMKLAALGFASVTIGGGMLFGLYKLSDAAREYTRQLEMMKTAGLSLGEQHAAILTANRVSNSVMTTSPAENLKAILELRAALNSAGASNRAATQEAIQYLAVVQRAQTVMQATAGGRAVAAHGGVYDMVKALEEIGATRSPERFSKLLGGMVQASEAFGGKVGARDWFQTLKYTRGAGQYYSDDFIQHYLPTLIQELKTGSGSGQGGGPGAPLATLFQTVVANHFSQSARDLGISLGLINPHLSTRDRHGRIHNAPGAWAGADLAASNPAVWAQQILIPALSRQMGGHMMDRGASGQFLHVKEMAGVLATLFGNRTAQQMVNLLLNVPKMEGDKRLTESAMPLSTSFEELVRRNPDTAYTAMHAQFGRVLTDMGKSVTPVVIGLVVKLAEGLNYFAGVIERHPVITQWILAFVGGLGALLVTMGTLSIAFAAIAAISLPAAVIAGVVGLGAAMAYLATGDHWDKLAPQRRIVEGAFSAWGREMEHGAEVIRRALPAGAARWWAVMVRGAKVLDAIFGRWADDIIGQAQRWTTQIVSAVKTDLQNVWIGTLEGLKGLVASLGAWFRALPQSIMGYLAKPPTGPNHAPGDNPLFFHGAYHPPMSGGPFDRSANVNVHNVVYLDGEVIYKNMERRRAKAMSKPPADSSSVDARLNVLYNTRSA